MFRHPASTALPPSSSSASRFGDLRYSGVGLGQFLRVPRLFVETVLVDVGRGAKNVLFRS